VSGNGERKGNGKQPGDSAGQAGSDSSGNGEQDGGFDAIAAAAELAESLGETEQEPASAEKMLELEVLELTHTLQERDRQLAQANQRAAAVEAEIERVKQRLERDGDRELEGRTRKILLAFLEVLDDLDRALVSVREDVAGGDATQEVVRGVELVRSSFLTKLGSFGVSHLPAAGSASIRMCTMP